MIRRAFCYIAGIDRHTLSGCPVTDKLWATHLGFSLSLSFFVVLGISFHASGYVIPDTPMRVIVCTVIALTIFMFDRALYQSDWFYQGIFRSARTVPQSFRRDSNWNLLWKLLRISVRLVISVGLAWVLSVFVELAIFTDTISEKIKSDYSAANRPIFQKIAQFEAQLDTEIRDRYAVGRSLDDQYQRELRDEVTLDPAAQAQFNYYDEQKKLLDGQEQRLQGQIREAQQNVRKYQEDMNAEELGQRLRANNSGLVGKGPRFEFAKRQKELYEREEQHLVTEVTALTKKRQEFTQAQQRIAAESAGRRNEDRSTQRDKRQQLEQQIAQQELQLETLQSTRNQKVEQFRANALSSPDYQKLKDDPLSRMTAYQELKSDPKDGTTITLFSWMTKFLIIFLEVVPVVAKMFFSPPSVYAAKIQAVVEQSRLNAEKDTLEREQQVVEQEIELQERKGAYDEKQRERENADLRHGIVQDSFKGAHGAVVTEFPSRVAATPAE